MFGTDFGEKCIIMQFLGMEKDGKDKMSERRDTEFAEKEQKKTKKNPPI
jgi:hypothetical protein